MPVLPSSQNAPMTPNQQKVQQLTQDIDKAEKDSLLNFQDAREYLQQLVSSWQGEVQRTEGYRLTRDVDVDVASLRENGDIEEHETFVPDRVIDSNIQREMPPYVNFLKNSRRRAIFNDVLDPTFDTQQLEDEFTKTMSYKGWIKPWYKILDGGMTHGWASFEVIYDTTKPGNCAIEYIAHEDLLFPQDSKDIQSSSCILRRYRPTPLELKQWCIKFGFDLLQVDNIIQRYKEKGNKDKTVEVFKRLCKYNGVVYVSWFSIEGACTDWLKQPAKLYCGVDELQDTTIQQPMPSPIPGMPPQMANVPSKEWQPKDINNYPIFIWYYRESEKPLLFDHIGRAFLDKPMQEASTAITTAFVNSTVLSANIYASPVADTMNDGKPAKQLASIKWANGSIFDKPMNFFTTPAPDAGMLKALEYLDTTNSQDIGQTNYAAINRQDSKKTATEINAADQESQLLSSSDLTLFSEFIRETYSFCWIVVRSQALQFKIKFLQISKQVEAQSGALQLVPVDGSMPQIPGAAMQPSSLPMQPAGMGQGAMPPDIMSIVNAQGSYQAEITNYTNDIDTIIRNFEVRAAGDVDVIQKQEQITSMQQDWPVVQSTPLAQRFLADYIKLKYPQDNAVYSSILLNGDPHTNMIMSLGTILQALVAMPEVKQHINPQMMGQLQMIEQQAMQIINPQQQAASGAQRAPQAQQQSPKQIGNSPAPTQQ